MKRETCSVCLRAKLGCICHLFTEINNQSHVVVLQHPSEVKQTKGTVTLLANSLTNCDIIIGENFSGNQIFEDLLSEYENDIVLLYPSEKSEVLVSTAGESKPSQYQVTPPRCIVLIDATWKKSYKMYMLNEALQTIPHLTLPEDIEGDYRIRKTQKERALSSLEACVYSLVLLENDTKKYQPLLNSFKQFNDFQLSFKPQK